MVKIRKGFVSNSSSSSFICEVCGENYSGMDACLEEAEMFECKNGHIVCEEHFNGNFYEIENESHDSDFRYGVPERYCPICTKQVVLDSDLLKFILEKFNVTQEEMEEEYRNQ